jgi:hypothetical protein
MYEQEHVDVDAHIASDIAATTGPGSSALSQWMIIV